MSKKPNIILIMSDDLGYEVINANGGTSYETPTLNELARTGIRFENAAFKSLSYQYPFPHGKVDGAGAYVGRV